MRHELLFVQGPTKMEKRMYQIASVSTQMEGLFVTSTTRRRKYDPCKMPARRLRIVTVRSVFLQGATSRIAGAEVCPAPSLFCGPSHLRFGAMGLLFYRLSQ